MRKTKNVFEFCRDKRLSEKSVLGRMWWLWIRLYNILPKRCYNFMVGDKVIKSVASCNCYYTQSTYHIYEIIINEYALNENGLAVL